MLMQAKVHIGLRAARLSIVTIVESSDICKSDAHLINSTPSVTYLNT